jgi:tRNA G18 (ribose-2'-O)-methylase SpoU
MDRPLSFVVTFNVSKRHNIGTIARACTAFDVEALCLVGSREYNSFGSHGSDNYVNMMHFNTLDECCDRLRTEYKCSIVGVHLPRFLRQGCFSVYHGRQ